MALFTDVMIIKFPFFVYTSNMNLVFAVNILQLYNRKCCCFVYCPGEDGNWNVLRSVGTVITLD
jgi:hypothetical protein